VELVGLHIATSPLDEYFLGLTGAELKDVREYGGARWF
jgi:hypothetical protein